MLMQLTKIWPVWCFAKRNQSLQDKQEKIIQRALSILLSRLREKCDLTAENSDAVRDYLMLKLSSNEREVFACLFLDNKNRLIEYQEMFFGTINYCSIHAREVVKVAIGLNAAAVILAHNHPSGSAEESVMDKEITSKLIEALSLINVRVLDHFIIGHNETLSFSERGYM